MLQDVKDKLQLFHLPVLDGAQNSIAREQKDARRQMESSPVKSSD